MTVPDRFWERKSLAQLTSAEWESLCDRCGRCCLIKLEDEESGRYYFTDVACKLFDGATCRCSDYANRDREVPDCVRLTPDNIGALAWMPPTCAYRLIGEGKKLAEWHPLISGRAETVIEAGISVRGRISGHEGDFSLAGLIERIRAWPGQRPRGAGKKAEKSRAGAA